VRPVVAAVSVFVPGVAPSVQPPTVAMPDAFVVCVAPVTVPPPDATVKVTPIPDKPAPEFDVTFTVGSVDTGWPATPVSVVADTAAMLAGVVDVIGVVAGGPSEPPHESCVVSNAAESADVEFQSRRFIRMPP